MRSYLLLLLSFTLSLGACQQPQFQRADAVTTPAALPTSAPDTQPDPVPVTPLPDPTPTSYPVPTPEPAPLFQDCDKDPSRPIVAELYALPVNTQQLPDFTQLPSMKKLCLKQLDITDRDFKEGFPGVDGLIEWFGLNIAFQLNVPATGDYVFALNSDDGSRLFIDGKEWIDNDWQHEQREKTAIVPLTAGLHTVRVPYFQGPRYRIALELKWKAPGDAAVDYIPASFIRRP